MTKRLIVLSDGTGNSAAKFFKTNVWKVYEALDLSPSSQQIALYDDGVGTASFKPLAILGGVFGYGLKRNVLNIYTFLSRHYGDPKQPGFEAPEIYGFGFSRGAFTIRVVVGLIDSQGLIPMAGEREMRRTARLAYRAYRKQRCHTLLRIEVPFRAMRDAMVGALDRLRGLPRYRPSDNVKPVRIRFLGLWDTVGAYGVPIEEIHRAIDTFLFPMTFASHKLLDCVDCARHALSIDDERSAFSPVLWDHESGQRLKQVWFCGAHSNVGGGYPDDSLSSEPLAWIVNATAKRLAFRPEALAKICAMATPFGKIYDSRAGFGAFYRYQPRQIPCDLARNNTPIVHESVVLRMATSFQGYAPISLPDQVQVIDKNSQVLEFKGFRLTARQRTGRFAAPVAAVPQGSHDLFELISLLKTPKLRDVEHVRAAVLQRRATYFGTLIPSLLLLFLPLLEYAFDPGQAAPSDQGWIRGFLSAPLEFLEAFTPRYLVPWTDAFLRHPGWTVALLTLAITSYIFGNELKTRIADRARAAWQMGRPSPSVSKWTRTDQFADRLLKSRGAYAVWKFVKWRGIPFAVFLAFLIFLVVTLDRTAFGVQAATGLICSPSADVTLLKPVTFEWSPEIKLEAATPCHATSLLMQQGQRYLISIALPPTNGSGPAWSDGGLEADLAGVNAQRLSAIESLVMSLGAPFRRLLGHALFAPIARIGAHGNDEYPLVPQVPFQPANRRDEAHTMTSEIAAKTTGELFLFVNDAYSGLLPIQWIAGQARQSADGSVRHMYGNNMGTATVKVRRKGYNFPD